MGRDSREHGVVSAWEGQLCTSSTLESRGSFYTIRARESVQHSSGTADVHPHLCIVVYEASKRSEQSRPSSWPLRKVVLPLRFRSRFTAIAVTNGTLQHDMSKLLSDRTYTGQHATPPVQDS